MEVRVINQGIVIFEEGSQNEVVRIPLSGYDIVELFYLREIFKTLVSPGLSAETCSEISSAISQIEDVLAARLKRPDIGLVGDILDVVV